jgi:hypothetical protein
MKGGWQRVNAVIIGKAKTARYVRIIMMLMLIAMVAGTTGVVKIVGNAKVMEITVSAPITLFHLNLTADDAGPVISQMAIPGAEELMDTAVHLTSLDA